MDTKRTARTVGILYILGTAAGIASVLTMGPILKAQDSLAYAAAHGGQAVLSALAILAMGFSLAMIPIMMYPILRKHDPSLALGYVVFRGGLEAVIYMGMAASFLLLLPVGRAYVQLGDGVNQSLGTLLLGANDIVSPIGTIAFIMGALMFYSILYRSRLVPRWISVWGFIAAVPFLSAAILNMFGAVDVNSPVATVCDMPLAVQEMVLAVWLIVKGFSPEALTVKPKAA